MWDENMAKAVNGKWEAYKKYLSTNGEEDKIHYHRKRAIAKREICKKKRKKKRAYL
jgi:hypothetical protein